MSSKQAKEDADPVTDFDTKNLMMKKKEKKNRAHGVQAPPSKVCKVVKLATALAEHSPPEAELEKRVKAKSEIDAIFGLKRRKKAEGGRDDVSAQGAAKKGNSEVMKLNSEGEIVKPKKKKKMQVAKPTKSTTAATAPASRKKTDDGFTVYSAEELGFNKKNAGRTKLCPFDCDCCF